MGCGGSSLPPGRIELVNVLPGDVPNLGEEESTLDLDVVGGGIEPDAVSVVCAVAFDLPLNLKQYTASPTT